MPHATYIEILELSFAYIAKNLLPWLCDVLEIVHLMR
jgi:hypothetical protein